MKQFLMRNRTYSKLFGYIIIQSGSYLRHISAGDHTHLTNTSIIYHTDNEPSFSGVSRCPPYITADGQRVVGPPSNVTEQPTKG